MERPIFNRGTPSGYESPNFPIHSQSKSQEKELAIRILNSLNKDGAILPGEDITTCGGTSCFFVFLDKKTGELVGFNQHGNKKSQMCDSPEVQQFIFDCSYGNSFFKDLSQNPIKVVKPGGGLRNGPLDTTEKADRIAKKVGKFLTRGCLYAITDFIQKVGLKQSYLLRELGPTNCHQWENFISEHLVDDKVISPSEERNRIKDGLKAASVLIKNKSL